MSRATQALILILWAAGSTVAATLQDKQAVAEQVYADLVAAVGDARTAPALRLTSGGNRGVQVAWFSPREHVIYLEERTYDVCANQGADSLAALAVLLGHELAHFYHNHDWIGDFGNGFADLAVGRQLRQEHRERGPEYETVADLFGGFYGYVAGYNTLGVAPGLLDDMYASFELDEAMPGYPVLPERREIARRSQEQLRELIPVFDAAHHLLVLGEPQLAAGMFDWLARDFPSREILNNTGVASALAALELAPSASPWVLPFELDADTRLRQAALGQRAISDSARYQHWLQRAKERFISASSRDPQYVTARINLAAVQWLQGDSMGAQAGAADALAAARDAGDPLALADALLVRGICQAADDTAAAASDFRHASSARPELARRNLAALQGEGPVRAAGSPTGPREQPIGPGSAVYKQIFQAPTIVELSGANPDGGDLLLLWRDIGESRGYVIDTGGTTRILLETRTDPGATTAGGVAIGSDASGLVDSYGAATRLVAGTRATWHVFPASRIAFAVTDGGVSAWLRYHTDEAVVEAPPPSASAFGPRVALVIGNQDYADSPLRRPAADAQAMGAALRAAGFEVIARIDADRSSMAQAIRGFGERLVAVGGVGLFYYAGHGVQVGGVNYLIPVGADIQRADEVADEAISIERVLAKMESAGNDVNILLLDACRNNPYSGARSGGTGLAPLNVQGTFVAYATQPGKVAADGGAGEHSLFTGSLLRHLHVPGQSVTELAYAVRNEVSQATRGAQFPMVENGLTGKFYFVPEGSRASDLGYARIPPTNRGADMVDVGGWRLDRTEVSNRAFAQFLNARGNVEEDGVPWIDLLDDDAQIEEQEGRFAPREGYEEHPVVEVSWHAARRYCEWRGASLPTGEQWRSAAEVAGRTGNFQGGDDGFEGSAPVGIVAAQTSGPVDMAGNVWEWVDDADGTRRLVLGGSWFNDPAWADSLLWLDAAHPNEMTGFRCASR